MGDCERSALTEMAVGLLLDDGIAVQCIPVRLAETWPDIPALQLCLELAAAANAVEMTLVPAHRTRARIEALWRIAALIGADVHALQMQGRAHQNARDLVAYWQIEDPFFGGAYHARRHPA